MTSKRLLTLVLAFCLLISVISPAAGAAQVAVENNTGSSQGESASTDSEQLKDLIVSGQDTVGNLTLRDDQSHVTGTKNDNISYVDGQWIATTVDGISTVLTDAELPDYIQALRKAAESYSTQEVVSAFIVLEDAPTAEQYSSIDEVPAAKTEYLSEQQDSLISAIEEEVLAGEELNVVTQFTYLTNSVVVETEFGNLETIASMDGVKSVFLTPVYYPCETNTVVRPNTVSSSNMTSVSNVWESLGYTGAGMTIAILDTGLDLDHPSFAADPALTDSSWTSESVAQMLADYDLNAETLYTEATGKTLSADKLYSSAKVPFIFNYAMGTTNVSHTDGLGDHGTHVAGIAAANDVAGSGVVGMAPDAQIIVMKVFNSQSGGASMYDLIAALEDAMTLGVDVVNMSLGSAAGFSESNIEAIDEIFQNISNTDIIVDVAAGNEGTSMYGSLYGNYMNTTEHIDSATISAPSTYANSMAIASVDNVFVAAEYFTLADGTNIFFQPSVEYLYEYTYAGMVEILADLGELEYVVVPNLGDAADFYDEEGNSIVEGKVALVSRGTLAFSEKAFNAQDAGALAVLIWDNEAENIFNFGMTTSDVEGYFPDIPVALISLADGQKMADAETKTMTVSAESGLRVDEAGGQLSYFSCWGVAPDLSLLPDITGVGGNVYSCYDGGSYGLMSGTSMATPQVAGVTALVLQYLKQEFPNASDSEIRVLVDSLMMSTAVPVIDSYTDLEASPRQQGAGLVNALAAVTAQAYLSVEGNDRPKAELGANENGTYSFTFTVHNYSDAAKTYELSSSLLCEDYETDENYPDVYFMAAVEHALDNAAVSFSSNTVTVAAGGTATVTVTINLTSADKTWIETYFPNGNYVEGFVYLTAEDEVTLSLPFLGFYGDWTAAPIFDTGYWYHNGFWGLESDEVEANQYFHVPFTSLGTTANDWVLGFSPYTGALEDEDGNIIYSADNNVISPNGDGVLDSITDYYLSMMRNAKWVYLTYTDANGNVLHQETLDYISKTMYNSNYGSTVPFVYSWYYDGLYDFTDENGEYLAHGTELTLTISAALAYGDDADERIDDVMIEIPIYIDTVAPVLGDNIVETTDGESNFLTLVIEEEHPAYVALMNNTGTQVYNTYSEADMTDNGDGTYSITVDVTGLGDNFTVALCDYGCNEEYYELSWSESGANNPEMDLDALYAYQVYNEYIYYYYGYDYMFGWSTIDKESAEVTMLQSDAYEYYALIAAEYAGGYVFAVDAGYNFIYMVPGLWNRNVICNLGVNVMDMAFDETTGTMYLTTKDDDNYSYGLYTIDLLTGELTQLWDYGSSYYMPWAMTFVDGELYCCRYYYNGFYKVDFDNYYTLVPVTDAEGNEFQPTTSTGDNVRPGYSQSMTYSQADGKIYWAYYNVYCESYELITIDPTTWTNTAVSFDWDQEYIGLLTLEDDGYTLPESEEVTDMVISDSSVVLANGGTYTLSVSLLPWNAPITEDVEWYSYDEDIATVDENGVVTAVGEGSAFIYAFYGDLYAFCIVNVVDINGHLNAYKYYDGNWDYGYWLDIDLENVTEEGTVLSPVDFIAADYNGHDGKIYGFDEGGQFYWFDPVTEEYAAVGTAGTLIPADMAYDYSTGLMYAIVYDYYTWSTTLYYVNMNTGALVEAATVYDIYVTLACDLYGYIYAINYYGELYILYLMEGEGAGGDGGIGGWEPLFDDDFGFGDTTESEGATSYYIEPVYVMQTPVTELFYAQSMCYDHVNDVILWVNPEHSTVYWLDVWAFEPFAVSVGDPSGSGLIEYTGLYVVPTEIPELQYTPVESVEAEDMMVLTGASKVPSVSVYPLNATNQTVSEWYSADPSIAYVDENGLVVGVSVGTTTIYATVVDTDEAGNEYDYDAEFNVTVKQSTDNIYGYLMTDLYNYDGYYWMEIPDTDPVNYMYQEYVYCNGAYMTVYSAEYVDGYIYAYGYDDTDWNATFQFMVIDASTWAVIDSIDMGHEFPFVYDLAYDYTTGTMYALAGTSSNTDLYMVNMENGKLIESVLTDHMFMSLAIDGNGTIYAMAASEEEFDWWTYTSTYTNAMLYTIDPATGSCEVFMDTGVCNNMISTMAYDYDTGYIYWASMFQGNSYESGLYLIDLEEMSCNNLGTIGATGSQVTGLMVIADEYPEVPEDLQNLVLTSSYLEVGVDGTVGAETFLQPSSAEVDMVWTSDDETVATVDDNGVVTGVSAGTTTITVTVVDGDKTFTASCSVIVYGVDDYFVTYNWTDGGFASIGRPDSTEVTNLTEGEEESAVRAMAMVNGYIYAYDDEGNLFVTSANDEYQRTYIGNCGIEVDEPYDEVSAGYYTYYYHYTPSFTIRDMAWDEANNRMLAIGCYGINVEYYYASESYTSGTYTNFMEEYMGCRLYEVNMQTGELVELCVIGGEDNAESAVSMLTVTDSGVVYVYSGFMDYVMTMDTETGAVEYLSTFQNVGMYGSTDGDPMAMVYDSITGNIYVLFTENGSLYYLYTFDPDTAALSRVDIVGVDYDTFGGLVLNEAHVCEYELVETKDATCTENGHVIYVCAACGETHTETIPSSGHSYVSVVTDPSCTESGYTTHTCETCDDSYVDSKTDATGHTYVDGKCECGAAEPVVEPDPESPKAGDNFSMALLLLMPVSLLCLAVLVLNRKKLLAR